MSGAGGEERHFVGKVAIDGGALDTGLLRQPLTVVLAGPIEPWSFTAAAVIRSRVASSCSARTRFLYVRALALFVSLAIGVQPILTDAADLCYVR